MKRFYPHVFAPLIVAVIALSCVFSSLAESSHSPFAEFRIDASDVAVSEQSIAVNIYKRDGSGRFYLNDTRQYTCNLNQTTGDASFFIQPSCSGVWVTADYLTDLNGDGIYEFLDGENSPVWDVMDVQGVLSPPLAASGPFLSPGQLYILSPDMLISRGRQAIQDRMPGGPLSLNLEARNTSVTPLCMITLHRADPDSGQSYTQTYYLEIHGDVLIPSDVPSGCWYYEAAQFVLSRGYFSGSDDGLFLPNVQLNRAQMAQVLWKLSGQPQADPARFPDVDTGDWFYQAVSWCQQSGLITGDDSGLFFPGDPLTREQLFTILHHYAEYTGAGLAADADLSPFPDGESVSSWAEDSMRWAVSNGLLSSTALRPGDVVSRAELAAVLYAYDSNLGLR